MFRSRFACCALLLVMASPAAHAYLDPSTGSMIVSAIIGVFATLTLAVKTYWYKLKSFFTGSKQSKESDSAAQPSDTDEQQA